MNDSLFNRLRTQGAGYTIQHGTFFTFTLATFQIEILICQTVSQLKSSGVRGQPAEKEDPPL